MMSQIFSPSTVLKVTGITLVVLVMSGCQLLNRGAASSPTPTPAESAEKVGDTTKTGVISEANGKFFIQESGQEAQPLDSYGVELAPLAGKTVTVTGQYSDNTLFVGRVE